MRHTREEYSERLQKALTLFLRGQDSDSVNHFFGSAFCEGGQYATVDLERGICRIGDEKSGDEISSVRFAITIELAE